VPKPDNGWYVVDQAGKLSTDQLKQLNTKIEGLNKSTKNEYGVLILNSLNGESIEDVAQVTARSWGIGKKDLNNGVLVVLAVADRKSRIQTGKGSEGDLPDLLCNDILKNTLAPHLKAGDFYGGLVATIDVMASKVESHAGAVSTQSKSSSDDGAAVFIGIVIALVIGIGGFVWYLIASSAKEERESRLRRARMVEENSRRFQREQEEFEARQRREAQALEDRRKQDLNREIERKKKIEDQRVKSELADKEVATYHESLKEFAKVINVPVVKPAVNTKSAKKIVTVSKVDRSSHNIKPSPYVATAVVASAYDESVIRRERQEDDARRKRQREEDAREEARAATRKREQDEEDRRRRDREDEDRRRRDREDEDRRSSYSSSSSSSSWSGSDSGSSSGSGFGGGDFGGGGSSGDW
jgi:uncharacterized membrane protein YgcG